MGCFQQVKYYLAFRPLDNGIMWALTWESLSAALIRLRGCAGWSAPLLFANPGRQFSHV